MNYLVTGGAGFIGSHLVDRLLLDKHDVTVIDDFSTGQVENLASRRVKIITAHITDDLSSIFKKYQFDVVFHLAAIPRVQLSIDHPAKTHHTNINGVFNLLMACKEFKVKRFVFASSSSVYGNQAKLPLEETMIPNPVSPYALHKLVGEQYCHLFNSIYGLDTVCLRYFNVYGPRQNPSGDYSNLIPKFIVKLQKNEVPQIRGTGDNTRDYTFVDDVVEATLWAGKLTNKKVIGQVINIGGGKNHSINEVAKRIVALTKSEARPTHGPAVIEPKDTLANIKKAKKLLGWKPRVSFEEGLRRTVSYFSKTAS